MQRGEGLDSGTCGRMAYRFCDFDEVGGYDQDFLPVGYQDVDLARRFKEMQKRAGQKNTTPIENVAHFGGAVPNDASNRKADRNTAKITEVAPNILQSAGTNSWGLMNATNLQIAAAKMKRGEIIRNTTFHCERERLGCWWWQISREDLLEFQQAEAQDSIGAHPSFSSWSQGSAFQPPSRGRGLVPPRDEPRLSMGRWSAPSLAGPGGRRPPSPGKLDGDALPRRGAQRCWCAWPLLASPDLLSAKAVNTPGRPGASLRGAAWRARQRL